MPKYEPQKEDFSPLARLDSTGFNNPAIRAECVERIERNIAALSRVNIDACVQKVRDKKDSAACNPEGKGVILDENLPKGSLLAKIAQEFLITRIACKCQIEQIERYGKGCWVRHYRRLEKVESPDVIEGGNGYLDKQALAEMYPSLGKSTTAAIADRNIEKKNNEERMNLIAANPRYMNLFQSLFTNSREFVVKRDRDCSIKHDILACLVDPRLIPDRLLENLHIVDFSKCGKDYVKRLEVKACPDSIDAFKIIFSNLKIIQRGREYFLSEVDVSDPNIPPKVTQKLAEYNKFAAGAILMLKTSQTREKCFDGDGEGINFKRRKVSFYPDAASRLRANIHTQVRYSAEFKVLNKQIQDLLIQSQLLDLWNPNISEAEKKNIAQGLRAYATQFRQILSSVFDRNKKHVAELLSGITESNRLHRNPRACMMILTAAYRCIERRIEEINGKSTTKDKDVNYLWRDVIRSKRAFSSLWLEVETYRHSVGLLSQERALFPTLGFKSKVEALKNIRVAPYNTFARAIVNQFENIKTNNQQFSELDKIATVFSIYDLNENLDNLMLIDYSPTIWRQVLQQCSSSYEQSLNQYKDSLNPNALILCQGILQSLNNLITSIGRMNQNSGLEDLRKQLKVMRAATPLLDAVRAID